MRCIAAVNMRPSGVEAVASDLPLAAPSVLSRYT
jgi:hypothetical protein